MVCTIWSFWPISFAYHAEYKNKYCAMNARILQLMYSVTFWLVASTGDSVHESVELSYAEPVSVDNAGATMSPACHIVSEVGDEPEQHLVEITPAATLRLSESKHLSLSVHFVAVWFVKSLFNTSLKWCRVTALRLLHHQSFIVLVCLPVGWLEGWSLE